MLAYHRLWWPNPPAILTYAIAVLSVTAALILAWWIEARWQSVPHVSLFICAVMCSAWFGGIGPGLVASVLSVLAFDYYFLPPIYSLDVYSQELPRLLFFALSALLVGSLSAAQRRAGESLRDARDNLHQTVQELESCIALATDIQCMEKGMFKIRDSVPR
jgi:K+-sensing histidine kinase KdpD